MNVLYMNLFTT